MKKQIGILLLLSITALSACDKREEPVLASNDQKIVWEKEQAKSFGKYYDLNLSSEEMQKVMSEKFDLAIPDFVEKAVTIMDEELLKNGVQKEEAKYTIEAAGDTLLLSGLYVYTWPDNQYYVYGTSDIQYKWDKNLEKAFISSQQANLIQQSSTEEKLTKPVELVKEFAEVVGMEEIDSKLTTFKEAYDKGASGLANQSFMIENTTKQSKTEKSIGRDLHINFNENGIVTEISLYTKDNSKNSDKATE